MSTGEVCALIKLLDENNELTEDPIKVTGVMGKMPDERLFYMPMASFIPLVCH